jgi:hypothetical protein
MEGQIYKGAEAGDDKYGDYPGGFMVSEHLPSVGDVIEHEPGEYPVSDTKEDNPDNPFKGHAFIRISLVGTS